MGASGSSQMSATSLVPSGSPLHSKGGDTSSPSPVYLLGMAPPASKAGLDTRTAMPTKYHNPGGARRQSPSKSSEGRMVISRAMEVLRCTPISLSLLSPR